MRRRLGGLGGLGVAPHPNRPQGGDGEHQPEAAGPGRVGHLGLVPLPAAALEVLETGLDPGPQAVPGDLGRDGRQVGHDQPALSLPSRPARQQGAGEPAVAAREAHHVPTPGGATDQRSDAGQQPLGPPVAGW
jgi:hypothetical protein